MNNTEDQPQTNQLDQVTQDVLSNILTNATIDSEDTGIPVETILENLHAAAKTEGKKALNAHQRVEATIEALQS